MKRITIAATAIVAAGALALSGCSSDETTTTTPPASPTDDSTEPGDDTPEPPSGEATKVGIALPEKTSENWVIAEGIFNEKAAAANVEASIQFATGGVAEQQAQIDAFIQQGVKVIVIGALDGEALGTQVEAARAAGIKVIAYDRLLKNTENVDLYVAFDPYAVGVLQGTAVAEGLAAWYPDAKPWNVEFIAGDAKDANSKPFFEGGLSVLQPLIDAGDIIVQSGQTTQDQAATDGWQARNAQDRMETILSGTYSDKDLHGVLSPNDTLARAALAAVTGAGKASLPVISGQDSEKESVELVAKGVQYQTVFKDTNALVDEVYRQVNLVAAGGDFEQNGTVDNGAIEVPQFLLTPVSVTHANILEAYANDATLGPVAEAAYVESPAVPATSL